MTEPTYGDPYEHAADDSSTSTPTPATQVVTFLTADDILSADDRKSEPVEVPEWGGTVLVRGLSGEDRDAYESGLTERRRVMTGPNKGGYETVPNLKNGNAKLVALAIVDPAGNRLFSDHQVALLGQKSSAALSRCFEVAARLSGMTDTAVEDAEGNSEDGPSADGT